MKARIAQTMIDSVLVLIRLLPVAVALIGCGDSATGVGDGEVHERWYQSQASYGRARPATSEATVYFGTGDGQVVARDVNSGAPLWSTRVSSDAIKGANLVVSKKILVAAAVFDVVGLDATTGRKLWRYQPPKDTIGIAAASASPGSLIDSRIDSDSETVYIPAWGASVTALDLQTGSVRWIWEPGAIASDTAEGAFRSGSMGVRVSGDTLFATMWHFTNRAGGTSDAWLVAMDKHTGGEMWRVRLPAEGAGVMIQTAPVFYQNLVIVHTVAARTFAIDRTNQKVVWDFTAPGYTRSTLAGPELLGDIVYVDGGDGQIYALGAADGTVVWRGMFGLETTRDLLVTDRHIIFPSGTELHVLDRQTGKQVLVVVQPHTSDPLFASPAVFANGLVFVTVSNAAWCFEEP